MDANDVVLLVISVTCFGNLLNAIAYDRGTHFQMDANYSGFYCSDENDVIEPVRSNIHCARRCSDNKSCKAFFYNAITGKCSTVKNVPKSTDECQDEQGSVYYKKEVALVTGEHGISDSSITASSAWLAEESWHARLDNDRSWSALDNNNQYIQFEFEATKIVNKIITQGNPQYFEWVTSFKLQHNMDCATFQDYNQTFNGNIDKNSHVSNEINPAILAKCFRVNPQTWKNNIAMRVELIGCDL